MIVLEDEKESIKTFIINSIEEFKTQVGKFTSIGIYACPWAGWMSVNFNTEKSLSDTEFNCPNFDVVEYRLLELDGWQDEYENGNPKYMFEGKIIAYDYDLGDELLNGLFFKFVSSIVLTIKKDYKENILLQMLDSLCKGTF
jgi:hypothetical protein